jgi:hypothetical protein
MIQKPVDSSCNNSQQCMHLLHCGCPAQDDQAALERQQINLVAGTISHDAPFA